MQGKNQSPGNLHIVLQKILRNLDIGRSMNGKPLSIPVTQMRVLSFFNEQDVIHSSEISRVMGKSIASINNIVSRLEAAGYVEKTPNPENRRFSDIRLTAEGRRRFEAFRNEQLEIVNRILNRLDAGEKERLVAALQEAADILDTASSRSKSITTRETGGLKRP